MHDPTTALDSPSGDSASGGEPTILLVADGERLAPALAERLTQHGVHVELATPASAVTTAFVSAPDIVVLAGHAAIDGGEEILTRLTEDAATSLLPVILIADASVSADRLRAFRHGVVAVIERSASADEMARQIAAFARELPERHGEASGALETASLDDIVALFAESLRAGILSVKGAQGAPSAQVVLRPDRPVAEAIGELVERLKPMLAGGNGALSYEFHEAPTGKIASINLGDDDDRAGASLEGVRLLVIQANAARADLLAQELRAAGATVAVGDGSGAGLELAHDLAPDVVLMDGAGVDSWALEALRAIRRDPRLRTASLLVIDSDQLWKDPRRPNVSMIAKKVEDLMAPDRELASRVRANAAVGARLDLVGPIRLLRTLLTTELGLGVSIVHPRLHAHIDLADGLVVGASARLPGSTAAIEGPAALASLLGLGSGRVQVVHAEVPRSANIMAPIDAALAAATKEQPLVSASLPPPSATTSVVAGLIGPAIPGSLGAGDLPALVGRLEDLVQHLESIAPDPAGFGEEHTANYSPAVMEQLRRRLRRSSGGFRAVRDSSSNTSLATPAASSAGAPEMAPPAAMPSPGVRPPAPHAPRGKMPPSAAKSKTPATSARTSPGVIPAPPPAPAATAAPPPAPGAKPFRGRRSATLVGIVSPEYRLPPGRGAQSAPIPALADGTARSIAHDVSTHRPPELDAGSKSADAPLDPALDAYAIEFTHSPLDDELTGPAHELPEAADWPVPLEGAAHADEPPTAPMLALPPLPETATSQTLPLPVAQADLLAPVAVMQAATLGSPPRRTRALWPLAMTVAVLLALGVLGAFLAFSGDGTDHTAPIPPPEPPAAPLALEPAPTIAGGPLALAEAPEPTRVETTAAPPVAPPGAGPRLPLGPTDPIEGRDADFDLSRLGVTPGTPPPNRRTLTRRVSRALSEAYRFRSRSDFTRAEASYRGILSIDPENPRATAGLALVNADRGDALVALVFAQRLTRLRPEYANNFVLLGDCYLAANDAAAARRTFEHALELEPGHRGARERLAALP